MTREARPELERSPAPPDAAGIRRLLVRLPNWLGDVLLALPALGALRRRFPGAEVSVLLRPSVAPLLRGHPDADQVLEDPREAGDRSPVAAWSLGRRLGRAGFDAAAILSRSLASALSVRLAGIPVRAGLSCHHRGPLLTHPVPETWERRHERHHAEVMLDVARVLGAEGAPSPPRIRPSEEDREEARRILDAAGLERAEPYLAVHPGASRPERTWPTERFGRVARLLSEERGLRPVILGTVREAPLTARAVSEAGPGAVDLTGRAGLRALLALHEGASLVLANDSGPMHLAAASGAPAVAVFGPGDPLKTAPLSGGAPCETVTLGYPCSPCRQRFFRECRPAPSRRPYCLHDLRDEAVLGAARRVLDTPRA